MNLTVMTKLTNNYTGVFALRATDEGIAERPTGGPVSIHDRQVIQTGKEEHLCGVTTRRR
jgi:hypothetical protein